MEGEHLAEKLSTIAVLKRKMMSGFCYTETGCLFLCLYHMHVLDAYKLFVTVGEPNLKTRLLREA